MPRSWFPGGQQLLVPELAAVLELQIEAGGIAELQRGGHVEHDDARFAVAVELLGRPRGHGRRRLCRARTLGPILQLDGDEAGILGATGEIESDDR